MLAVMFNSLLILLPVIGARAIANAASQDLTSPESIAETLQRAEARLLEELSLTGPRVEDRKLAFWQGRIMDELEARNMAAVRGYLLAAPQLLGREMGQQLRLRADAEVLGTQDERLIRAALLKLPENVAAEIEATERFIPPQPVSGMPDPPEPGDMSADTSSPDTDFEPIVLRPNAQPEDERRFQLLGSFADLSAMSRDWDQGERSDALIMKLTALGLIQQDYSDGLSDAAALSVSILKSARRSQRLTTSFTDYLEARVEAALPDEVLAPRIREALSGLATSEVRADRVREAFAGAVNRAGVSRLEEDLEEIRRLSARTSPAGALTILSVVDDGTDLHRARLLAEAGGERVIVLIREQGAQALALADAGISWNRNTVLEMMSLTAAGMLLFWVMLSTVRLYIRLPEPKPEPYGA